MLVSEFAGSREVHNLVSEAAAYSVDMLVFESMVVHNLASEVAE